MSFEFTNVISHSIRNQDQTAANVERMQELCTRYISILLPHVKSCLDKMFPPPLLAKTMGLSHLEFKKLLDNPNELLIHHFQMEPINSLLQEYVKVQEVIEQEVEYHFMEPEQGVTLQTRNEAIMDSSPSSEGKNELKDGSGMNERELTSLGMGDDKKRQADDEKEEGEREERDKEKLWLLNRLHEVNDLEWKRCTERIESTKERHRKAVRRERECITRLEF